VWEYNIGIQYLKGLQQQPNIACLPAQTHQKKHILANIFAFCKDEFVENGTFPKPPMHAVIYIYYPELLKSLKGISELRFIQIIKIGMFQCLFS